MFFPSFVLFVTFVVKIAFYEIIKIDDLEIIE